MYSVRFVMRCCTSGFLPLLMPLYTLPQIGISAVPCAGRFRSPTIELYTWSAGYLPLFFLASVVRSLGAVFRAVAAGPSPLALVPWQAAQWFMYISLPDAGETYCAGTLLIFRAAAATPTITISVIMANLVLCDILCLQAGGDKALA